MKVTYTPPVVKISPEARQKLKYFTNAAKGEVSGIGFATLLKDEAGKTIGFLVKDIFLVQQSATSSHSELDETALHKKIYELTEQGADMSTVRVWWHSHNTMNCFWSRTDDATIEALSNSGFTVSLLANKRGETLTRVDLYDPCRVTYDGIDLRMDVLDNPELYAACKKEVEELVDHTPWVSRRYAGYEGIGYIQPAGRYSRTDKDREKERKALLKKFSPEIVKSIKRLQEMYKKEELTYPQFAQAMANAAGVPLCDAYKYSPFLIGVASEDEGAVLTV